MSTMKRRKDHVSKDEARLTIPSTNGLGQNSGPLPTELIIEILSRLPAKPIARFRCLSKEWASILCSTDFTDLFLKMSCARPRLLFTFQTEGKWSFFSSPQSLISDKNSSPVVVANHVHVPRDYTFGICLSACGLVCTKDECILSGGRNARMMICNPITGRLKPLPKAKTRRVRVITYIGYDPIEKQVKVLCMTVCEKPFINKAEEHQVLTLGTEKSKWRMIECSVSHYPLGNEICINGVLYYLARDNGSLGISMIVCFDVRSEKFSFIKNGAFKDLGFRSTLINYKGQLGALSPDPNSFGFMDGRALRFELWVIEEIAEHKWSRHIHILPPLWKNLVGETLVNIVGMIGTSEIVFSPCVLSDPFYIFHLNIEKNSITRLEIQEMNGPFRGQNIYTFLNYVENVKFLM